MNDALMLGTAGLVGGLFGALLGGLLVWRQLRVRLARDVPGQLRAVMAPLLDAHLDRMQPGIAPVTAASVAPVPGATAWVESVLQAATAASTCAARAAQLVRDAASSSADVLGSHQAAQLTALRDLQDRLEVWQQAVIDASRAAVVAVPVPVPSMAPVVDLEPLALRLDAALDVRFEAQGQAWQEVFQRIPQTLRQALQVELDFLAQQQVQRDAVAAQRENENAAALRKLVGGLASPGVAMAPSAAPAVIAVPATTSPVAPRALAPSPPAVSARPPELLLTPLPRPEPVYDEPEPMPELSDEELDALPPELPAPDIPRKRILPAPKKPVLRNL